MKKKLRIYGEEVIPRHDMKPSEEKKVYGMVDLQFKTLTADLRDYLEEMKQRLDEAERNLQSFGKADRLKREKAILDDFGRRANIFLDNQFKEMEAVASNFSLAEHQIHRNYFRLHLHRFFLMAPFAERAYYKPLGIPGDYLMMEMLYEDHDKGESLFARLINQYTCSVAAARAVSKRVPYILNRINKIIELPLRGGGPTEMTSIGSGPAKEIQDLIRAGEKSDLCHVHLVDMLQESLGYCQSKIDDLKHTMGSRIRVEYLNWTVQKLIRDQNIFHQLKRQDLIYCFGLFDYLPFHIARKVIEKLYQLLSDDGELIIGNFSLSNPSRYYMEYVCDWHMIHRSSAELLSIAKEICHASQVTVESDENGVQLYLCIKNESDKTSVEVQ